MTSAFRLREGENTLSVNWLENLTRDGVEKAVACIRVAFVSKGYRLRSNGRFVVLTVGEAKSAVRKGAGVSLQFFHDPVPEDRSHAVVSGIPLDDLAVAVELKALVRQEDAYLAIV